MTRDELILNLTEYAGDDYKDDQASLIVGIVNDAIEEVRRYRYRYGALDCDEQAIQTENVLRQYPDVVQRIAKYHYDKVGKEGVTTFYEAGQTTSWEAGGTPDSFFSGIVPIAKVV